MRRTIDVDLEQLKKFIESFQQLQNQVGEQLSALTPAWQQCDDSWQGLAKDAFAKEYESTDRSLRAALESGEESLTWLRSYCEIVEEIDESR